MKNLILLIAFLFGSLLVKSDVIDVYQNKFYDISNRVLKDEIDKIFLSSKFEFLQHQNNEADSNWKFIEAKLRTIVKDKLNSDFEYFKIQTQAQNLAEQSNKYFRARGRQNELVFASNIELNRIEITLESVVNGFGTYSINYIFQQAGKNYYSDATFNVNHYYLSDFNKRTITEISKTLSSQKIEFLKRRLLPKCNQIYKMNASKLNSSEIENIYQLDKDTSYSNKFDFSEVKVYPFFSGIVVVFPKLSQTSLAFHLEEFKLLIREYELNDFLIYFPEYKHVFPKNSPTQNNKFTVKLNEDKFYSRSFIAVPPSGIELIKSDKKIKTLTMNNFRLNKDGSQTFNTLIKQSFDLSQQLTHSIQVNYNKDTSEQYFTYNSDNQLTFVKNVLNEGQSQVFTYNSKAFRKIENYTFYKENSSSNFFEYVDSDWYDSDEYDEEEVCIENEEQSPNKVNSSFIRIVKNENHFFYNMNYRYEYLHEFSGYENSNIRYRKVEGNQYCYGGYCLLTDDNQQIIAAQQSNYSLIDFTVNQKGQTLESYLDNGSRVNRFFYGENDKITSFESLNNDKITKVMKFEYFENETNYLIISEYIYDYSNINRNITEYIVEYWD